MGFYEDRVSGTVKNLMGTYGVAMTLLVDSDGTFDPETGGLTGSSIKSYTVQGLLYTDKRGQKNQTQINTKTRRVYLSPFGMTVVPQCGNRIKLNGVECEIIALEVIDPAGIPVLYDCQIQLP